MCRRRTIRRQGKRTIYRIADIVLPFGDRPKSARIPGSRPGPAENQCLRDVMDYTSRRRLRDAPRSRRSIRAMVPRFKRRFSVAAQMRCRVLIAVVKAEQTEGGRTARNRSAGEITHVDGAAMPTRARAASATPQVSSIRNCPKTATSLE